MSKLTEFHIQLNESLLLKNSIEFNSWIDSILKNYKKIPIEEFNIYKNFYLKSLVEIIYANQLGKLHRLDKLQEKLFHKLFNQKKVNRLIELKELFQRVGIPTTVEIENLINSLTFFKFDNEERLSTSINTAISNPEVYLKFENIRKTLVDKVELLDPLNFIENIFKVIPVIFESKEWKDLFYNYALNTNDQEFVDSLNSILDDDEVYKKITKKENNTKKSTKEVNIHMDCSDKDKKDFLGSIATLREKLVEGCETKQEYVNTLYEISYNYKKIGAFERSYFFAVIVNRLHPGYRNVGDLLK